MRNTRFLTDTALFSGIGEGEIEALLRCLKAEERAYGRGECVLQIGMRIRRLGVVLEGGVLIERVDAWGNRSILERVEAGEMFAEAYACAPEEPLTVEVWAAEEARVLFVEAGAALEPCGRACSFHARLMRNLTRGLAQKDLALTRKMRHITPRTIRGRLMSYLTCESVRRGAREFEIPFNRQQLADYLSVERSALSAEISKMRRDGLIACAGRRFLLLDAGEGGHVWN